MDAVRRDQCERSMEGRGDGGDILMKLAVPRARVRDTEYEQVVALGGLLGDRFLGRLVVLSDGDVDRRRVAAFSALRRGTRASAQRSIGGIALVVTTAMATIMVNRFWLRTA